LDSANPIDAVLFDAQFDPSDQGNGVLSVYLAGNLIGLIDESTAGHNVESYLFGLEQDLPPGTYTLAYRLDPEGENASSVIITNSTLVVPEPSTIALLLVNILFGLMGWAWQHRRRMA
jgi:hypothetical protein